MGQQCNRKGRRHRKSVMSAFTPGISFTLQSLRDPVTRGKVPLGVSAASARGEGKPFQTPLGPHCLSRQPRTNFVDVQCTWHMLPWGWVFPGLSPPPLWAHHSVGTLKTKAHVSSFLKACVARKQASPSFLPLPREPVSPAQHCTAQRFPRLARPPSPSHETRQLVRVQRGCKMGHRPGIAVRQRLSKDFKMASLYVSKLSTRKHLPLSMTLTSSAT